MNNILEFIYRKIGEKMMYTIIIIVVIFLIVNLPGYVRKYLMQQLADESGKAADNLQVSQLNLLSKIEWLRFYPLKKFFLGLLWCVCLYISVRGVFLTLNDPRKTFIFLTVLFWVITILSARKIWQYIKLPYHAIPVLNKIKTKEELKESLQGECFEKVMFEHKMLRKYFPVLISKNWVIIDGFLISRNEVKKIYFLHESPVWNYEQIRLVYFNDEEFRFPCEKKYADANRQTEISELLHKISPEVIEKAEDTNTSKKKDKSIVYWDMNYKGKFRRTLWFIPIVIILCFVTPLFMGRFWFIYDTILVFVLIWQLKHTYKMMKIEQEKSREPNESENKKYMIDMKNVHMYCYLLAIKDETNVYKAIIEAGTSEEESMLIWLDDFNFPKEEIEDIKEEIEKYFAVKNIHCIFKPGNRIKNC